MPNECHKVEKCWLLFTDFKLNFTCHITSFHNVLFIVIVTAAWHRYVQEARAYVWNIATPVVDVSTYICYWYRCLYHRISSILISIETSMPAHDSKLHFSVLSRPTAHVCCTATFCRWWVYNLRKLEWEIQSAVVWKWLMFYLFTDKRSWYHFRQYNKLVEWWYNCRYYNHWNIYFLNKMIIYSHMIYFNLTSHVVFSLCSDTIKWSLYRWLFPS